MAGPFLARVTHTMISAFLAPSSGVAQEWKVTSGYSFDISAINASFSPSSHPKQYTSLISLTRMVALKEALPIRPVPKAK